jgi:hypothetical protein
MPAWRLYKTAHLEPTARRSGRGYRAEVEVVIAVVSGVEVAGVERPHSSGLPNATSEWAA